VALALVSLSLALALLLCCPCRWLSCSGCVVSAGTGSVFWLHDFGSCVSVANYDPLSGIGSVVSVAGNGSVALAVVPLSLALFWLRGFGSCVSVVGSCSVVSVAGSLALAVLSLLALAPFLGPLLWLLCHSLCRWLLLCCLYLWLSGSCSCVPVAGPDSGIGSFVSVTGNGSVDLAVMSLALFWLRRSGSCVSVAGSCSVVYVAGSLALTVLSLLALAPFLDPLVWLLCLSLTLALSSLSLDLLL